MVLEKERTQASARNSPWIKKVGFHCSKNGAGKGGGDGELGVWEGHVGQILHQGEYVYQHATREKQHRKNIRNSWQCSRYQNTGMYTIQYFNSEKLYTRINLK